MRLSKKDGSFSRLGAMGIQCRSTRNLKYSDVVSGNVVMDDIV